jgi:hypothetical protein
MALGEGVATTTELKDAKTEILMSKCTVLLVCFTQRPGIDGLMQYSFTFDDLIIAWLRYILYNILCAGIMLSFVLVYLKIIKSRVGLLTHEEGSTLPYSQNIGILSIIPR